MRQFFTFMTLLCWVAGAAAQSSNIEIRDAWVRAVLPVQKSSAAYFTIQNKTDKKIVLRDVSAAHAHHTMMHRTVDKNGIASMEHVENIAIEAGQELAFKPGGLHVMMMGLEKEFSEQKNIKLTFTFDDGTVRDIDAVVKNP